jgi:hypothetical protein
VTATLTLEACTTDTDIGPSKAVTVFVSPAADTIVVGGSAQLHAVGVDKRGTAFVAPGATWLSMSPSIATVSATGVVTGVTPGMAMIQATLQGKSGTAQVMVTPPPAFLLYTDTVVFTGIANGPAPAAQTVPIQNFGGGTLSGVAIDSVRYVTGSSGWLTTALSGSTAPDTVTLQPGTTALTPGSHSAYVFLSAPNALNSPKQILAVFTVGVGAAASIAADSGDGQTAVVGTAVAVRPSVIVRDQYNNPVPGVAVTFAVTGGGGAVNPATPVNTDVNGRARVTSWTLGSAVGANTLEATSGSLTGSPVAFSATAIAGPAAQIAKSGGDAQSATVGTAVSTAPSVLVTDQFGNPVSGVSVTFAVASGGGSVTGGGATSDANGIAAVGSWTLGSTAGSNTLTATSGTLTGSPLTFTATGTAGAAATLVVNGGNGQSATVNTAVATAPSAKVEDAFGNGVAGIAVTFAVSGGGGTVSPTSPIFTDAQGVARVTSWTLGTGAGTNSLTATSGGLTGSPLSFTATGTAGVATAMVKDSGDAQTATAGTAVAVRPVVRVSDQFGNPVSGVSVTFAVTSGGGTVNPTSPVTTDAAGRVRAVSWTLGNSAGANSLTATSAGLTGNPLTFTATGTAGAAATIARGTGNSQTDTIGATLATALSVQVTDNLGNPVSGVTVNWAGTGGATPSTLSNTTNASGIASVSLTLGTTAGAQGATATSGSLTGSPVSFTETATHGNATQIAIQGGNGQTATAGSAVAVAPSAIVKDRAGNVVSGVNVTFAVTGGGGTVNPTSPIATNASGIAQVTSWTLGAVAGANSLSATSSGLTGSPLTFTATGTSGTASAIALNAGNAQSDTIGAHLTTPISVKVTDGLGNGVAGVTVNWAGTGGATVALPSSITDGAGVASDTLILGTTTGAQGATATSGALSGSPVTFTATATHGNATTIALNGGDSQTDTIGATLATAYTVLVTDRAANPVNGVTVTWAAAGGGSITASSITNAGGIASATRVLGTAAGTQTASGTAAGLTGSPVAFTATATHGNATTIALNGGNSQTDTIGATLGVAYSVLVTDRAANPVNGVTVTWAAAGGSITASSITSVSGLASATRTLGTTAGAQTATATAAGLAGSPVAFTATALHGNATTVAKNGGDAQSATAGTAVPIAPSAIVTDRGGNPVSGVGVTFAATASNGSVSPTSAILTNGSGIAQVTSWTLSAAAKPDTLTATSAGLTGSPLIFTATAFSGTATTMALNGGDAQTDTIGATLAVQYGVFITDSLGNPVGGIPVSWAVTGGGGSITPSSSTNGSGIAVATRVLGNTAGAQTATASVGGLTGSPVTFTATATHGNATAIALNGGNSQTDTIGATLGIAYTVLVTDRAANPVNGVTVSWAATGGGSITASSLTNASGIASATRTLGNTAGPQTATATAAGLTGSSVSFTATATAGNATTIALDGGNSQTDTIGATLPVPYTVLVTDRAANPVSGFGITWSVSGGGSITPSSSTNASGIASATRVLGLTAGAQTASATGAGLTGSPVGFTATATVGDAKTIALNAGDAQTDTIGATLGTALSVLVTDAGGNPRSGVTVNWAGTGGASPSGASSLTNGSGIASISLSLGTGAGAQGATATAAGLTGSPVTFSETATAGHAATLALSAGDGQTATVNTNVAIAPAVLVTDRASNPVSGTVVTFGVAGGGGSVTGATPTTDVTGVATLGSWKLGTAIGTNTMNATAAGLSGSPLAFTATGTADVPFAIAKTLGDFQTATVNTPVAQAPTVTVTDQFGNPVSGASVTFLVTVGGGTVNGASSTSVGTDGSGSAAVTWTLGTTAGTDTISASAGAAPTVYFSATATADVAQNIIALAGNAQTDTIGATLAVPLSVKVTDAFGNGVSGIGVTWAGTGGATPSTTSNSTDGSGIASVALTLGTVVGAQGATATSSGLTGSPVTFSETASHGNATQIAINGGDGQSATVNTAVAIAPSALVRDRANNVVPGVGVTFAATASNGTVNPVTAITTDASGIAQVTSWTLGTTAKTDSLTATSGSLTGSPLLYTATANPGSVSAAQSTVADLAATITACSVSCTVGSGTADSIIVTARDAFGNVIDGASVTVSVSGSNNAFNPGATGTTSGGGIFVTKVSSITAQAKTISAVANAVSITQTAAVTVSPAAVSLSNSLVSAGTATITACSTSCVAGSTASTITVTVRDAFSNGVSGATVTPSCFSGTSCTFTPSSGTTNASGVFSSAFNSTLAQAKTIQAVVSAVGTITQTAAVTVTAAAPSSVTVASGNSQTARVGSGVATRPTWTVRDAFSNLVTGQSVTISSGGGGTPSPTSGTTNGSGQFALTSWTMGSTGTETSTGGLLNTATLTAGSATGTATDTGFYTFSLDVNPLIGSPCDGCHYVSWGTRSNIVGVTQSDAVGYTSCTTGNSPSLLVSAGAANSSLIYVKLAGTAGCGSPMPPPSGGFTAAQLKTVRAWINRSALNN